MSIDIEQNDRGPRRNKALAGMVLLIVGFVVLIHQLNFFFFPYWLFSWPMILIVVGLYLGARHNFRNAAWMILVIIGGLNLLSDIFPRIHFDDAIFPLIIIAIGLRMITGRNRSWNMGRWDKEQWKKNWDWKQYGGPLYTGTAPGPAPDDPNAEPKASQFYGDDYLDATSVFSGVKRKILSKDFKGGDITNFFGGCDVDFTSADINGRVVIDVTQVFGGIKLIVPPHWHVTSDMVSLFAGFDDKRMQKSDYGSDKILVLKGTSVFAGVEIRSY